MKYLQLVCIFLLFACISLFGQVNQVWWSKGRVLHVNPVEGIDSVTFGQFVNADTFLIVIDRASRRIVYDTIDEHVPGMVFHDTIHTTHTVYLNSGRRIGVFSVAKDRQVSFSQGNLQYVRNQDVWKFADQQYEYIGAGNVKDGELANKIDLFGWSADNTTAPFGVSTSTNAADYSGEFVDWGVNEISGDAPNTWRTLSKDEWEYLINERPNAQQLRTKGSVNGNGGVILLPDDWVCPTECSVIMVPDEMNLLPDVNDYSLEEWRRMEDAGAVLLTAAGMRRNKDVVIVQHENIFGGYWASTIKSAQNSYCYNFHIQTCEYVDYSYWIYGRSVRLVHDTIVPPPAPCETFEVNGVKFNMMCVEGGTFMMGAADDEVNVDADEKPQHQVTVSDYMIGQTEVTQELWTAVMGSNPSKTKGDKLPVEQISWAECQEFISKLNKLTGLYFRLPTEAEWEFAARGGNRSRGFVYAGSDDIDEVAWTPENSENKTHNVGEKKPNELGIYDMSGNVYERCSDWYASYSAEPQINPQGPSSSTTYRVSRGGCAMKQNVSNEHFGAYYCRILNRGYDRLTTKSSIVGLRLVLDTHQYVDLGLSVMWATTNVGATTPEQYGDYFAWGETEPKELYDWSTYKWCDGTENNMTKYNAADGLKTLLPEDDAAHVNWGGEWRMPSEAELTELREYCTWQWTTQNGTAGYIVTGPNGNSIFLPDAGYRITTTHTIGTAYYWTRDLNTTAIQNANGIYFNQDRTGKDKYRRRCGFSVRPVLPADREILAPATPGKRIGIFSVAKDKQVSFSQGNLQYIQSANLWRFAENQYDYLGEENVKDGQLANRIDLFGWSANNTTAPFGVSMSTNNADYAGEFVDWGTNIIQGDAANTWRTLSKEEWEYLIKGRKNASNLRAAAQVNGVNGMILLPDDWECPEGIDFKAGYHTSKGSEYYAEYQQFTKGQWRELETTGAIFLPAAGMHDGNGIADIQAGGYYWSATDNGDTYAYTLISQSSGAYLTYDNRYDVRSVRLVHDTIVPPPAPCETFKVNGVTFNMMCVEGGTFTWGAKNPKDVRIRKKHQSTVSSFYLGQTPVTQELWQAVMGENPSYYQCDTCMQHPVDSVSWLMAKQFITRLNELTGKHFRLPTEEEWEFAAHGGILSKGFVFTGSDNIDEVAWNRNNANSQTHPVAVLKPNELGLYDMQGNVWEYTQDIYQELTNTYPSVNATGLCSAPYKGNLMVVCGGAYYWGANSFQDEYKITGWMSRGDRRHWTGMRLALSDEDPFLAIDADGYRFHMMLVKGGTFKMGAATTDATALANERPQHQVTLSDYYVGQTEVTRALWKTVMGSLPDSGEADNKPIMNVNYEECQTFIAKLNELTGRHFRLPTEAEWEFAARGGNQSKGYLFAGANDIDSVAWCQESSGDTIHAVAQLMPNELGIYDMSGNVFEWCSDWYGDYASNAQINPQGAASGTQRVGRGGGYCAENNRCRVTRRIPTDPEQRMTTLGLRLVLDTHQYVDLGLSVMWATTNVGATAPEQYGDYFAWGETEAKDVYDWSTYKWCDGTVNNITKYNATDGLKTLQPEDDAAHVNWGGEWRMPTKEERDELLDKCIWTWESVNGVEGFRVTGPNGNSIFLPAAGIYIETRLLTKGLNSYFFTSVLADVFPKAYSWYFADKETRHRARYERCYGCPIRPVLPTNREILTPSTPGKRIGVFSVAKDKQVSFSQGNLQYVQYRDEWRFAENQYDYLGEENIKDGQLANRIDLFGWSGKDNNAPYGISTSTNNADYAGEFVDWGTNIIQGDAANTWRTLSIEEWDYLIYTRANAAALCGVASVNGVHGLIILPDEWVCPEGVVFKSGFHANYSVEAFAEYQIINADQWVVLEESGAVFLSAAGWRKGKVIDSIQRGAHYWSSTIGDADDAHYLSCSSQQAWSNRNTRDRAFAVRLVHDTIVPTPAPCETFKVNGVTFNMMCVEGGTFMMGAKDGDAQANANEKPAHEVTLTYDYYMGQTEVTQGLWKAVMGSDNNPSTMKGDDLPVNNVLWGDARAFVYKLSQMTGLSFDLPTEAEWQFAARGGNRSKGYLYAGSDNVKDVAWYSSNSGGVTHTVATKQPNELGIYDMSGNVFEWCSDWLATYSAEAQVDPKGPISGEYHVYCGGGWYLGSGYCRSSHRRQTTAGYTEAALGFRVVLREKVKPEYVDLGLSVKWATFNLGASAPEEYGDYFAWGETEPKAKYGWAQYKWGNGENKALTKYCNKATYGEDGFTDNLTQLLPEDDAAHVNWGGNWRMPTAAEFDELINNCTIEKSAINGVNGYLLTSKINGNSIFLPIAGYYNFDLYSDQHPGSGTIFYYWSADMMYNGSYTNINAYNLNSRLAEDGGLSIGNNTRRCGFPIRPVYDDSILDSDSTVRNCYTFTQEHWDAATSLWGHSGRGHDG